MAPRMPRRRWCWALLPLGWAFLAPVARHGGLSTERSERSRPRALHVQRAAEDTEPADNKQEALKSLAESAMTRETEPEEVFEAIRVLEKAKNRTGESGFAQFLTGDWRLIYTTGTKKTEDDIGRINYVPITAVQRFDMEKKFIRNGVYLGPISIEFEGSLRWLEDQRRLEFDFEELKVCGASLSLPDWLRSMAGMKSS
ncbi:Uncharacterized protein SCF082_LOCUS20203, partial [Durusdinium trenchii]